MIRNRLFALALVVCVGALGACATGGGSTSDDGGSKSAAAKPDGPPKGVAPPAGHKMAKVDVGMGQGDVRRVMGDPTSQKTYVTGKAWIPWYWGSDTNRTEFKYKGSGRVVFNTNRWSGAMKVVRVDYDPKEDGY